MTLEKATRGSLRLEGSGATASSGKASTASTFLRRGGVSGVALDPEIISPQFFCHGARGP